MLSSDHIVFFSDCISLLSLFEEGKLNDFRGINYGSVVMGWSIAFDIAMVLVGRLCVEVECSARI